MKIFYVNGPQTASVLFGIVCFCVILYVGFFQDNTVTVSGDMRKPAHIALVIDGFGHGHSGTREFSYLDIPFVAVVDPTGPRAEEDKRYLENSGRKVIESIDEIELEAFLHINDLNKIIKTAQQNNYAIVLVDLSDGKGLLSAGSIHKLLTQYNFEFVLL